MRPMRPSTVELTFLRRYRLRGGVAEHSSFLFGSPFGGMRRHLDFPGPADVLHGLSDQVFVSKIPAHQEYKHFSTMGLPFITLSMLFKVIATAIGLGMMLFGLIKALIAAIKKLFKTIKKISKYATSMKMPLIGGDFLPDIPGLPKMPSLKIPGVPGLPSPPKLSIGKAFKMLGGGMSALLLPLAILAAIALLSKYRIFKARMWPPLSGLPGLRNGLYRLPYDGFKGVFSHLPYFDQLYNAGGRFLKITGLPDDALNPGKQPMSPRIAKPKIEGPGAWDYDMVMREYNFSHGVNLGKGVLVSSIILNLSMRFKKFKEMVPLMGPPTVKEMFGTEGLMKKLQRLLVKGAMAYAAYSATGFVAEGTCPWPTTGPSAVSFAQLGERLAAELFSETGVGHHSLHDIDQRARLHATPVDTSSAVLQAGLTETLTSVSAAWQPLPKRRVICEGGVAFRRKVVLQNFL